jgi:PAS domain S-box-containing protein
MGEDTGTADSAASLSLDGARRALEDASRRTRQLIDTANDAVVSIDRRSVIVDWNRTAETMFGWSREEAVGRVLTELIVPPQHREAHHHGLARFLADRGQGGILNRRVETTALARDGREFDIELAVWPVEAGDGEITFSAFIRDISRRKRNEQTLRATQEKYRQVVENAYEGIVITQDGQLKFANPRALELTRRTEAEALATPFIDMVHPDDRARVYGNYLRRMRGESVEPNYVFRSVTPDGRIVWLQIAAVAIEWEGRPATLNFLTDVSERVALEAQIRETLAEREAILETTAVGIMFIQNGRIKWINDALERTMLGWSDGETIGQTGEIAFRDHGDWSRFLQECIPALQRDGTYESDWEVRRKDGTPWWCHMSAKALNPANLAQGTIWFFLDISSRRRAEEEARRSLVRERELSDLKTRFVSLASHEFRTPLATILSSIELIDDFGPTLPENERRELIRLIKGAVGRVMAMIDQVEVIGRAEADKLEFRPELHEVEALVTSIAREAEQGHNARGRVRVSVRGVQDRRLLDGKLLFHILGNLVGNALKYSPAEVTLEVDGEPGALAFRVTDHGIGIPADDQPRIFESFHRARNVGNVEGTGLGLSIVKQCVELHGGNIVFESAVGRGTTFVARIPTPAP